MNKKLIKVLESLLVLIIIAAGILLIRQSSDYKKGQQDYSEAEQIANLPDRTNASAPSVQTVLSEPTAEDPYAAMLRNEIDLAALKKVNSDVLGWIEIPGTEISYPVLQGEDNDYYLKHTWKGESNSVGSIFLECQVDPELNDFNTIVYGHRMRDLSMFGSLKYYKDTSYWEANPCVYVMIEDEAYRYDIYAAYQAEPEDIIYGLNINSRPKKQELIQFGLENSVIETGIVPTTYDRILTLSTCTANDRASRWVVQAVYRVGTHSSMPDNTERFEGDDMLDNSSQHSEDSLTFTDMEESSNQNESEIDPYVILLAGVCLIVLTVVVIYILVVHFRKDKKK